MAGFVGKEWEAPEKAVFGDELATTERLLLGKDQRDTGQMRLNKRLSEIASRNPFRCPSGDSLASPSIHYLRRWCPTSITLDEKKHPL